MKKGPLLIVIGFVLVVVSMILSITFGGIWGALVFFSRLSSL